MYATYAYIDSQTFKTTLMFAHIYIYIYMPNLVGIYIYILLTCIPGMHGVSGIERFAKHLNAKEIMRDNSCTVKLS